MSKESVLRKYLPEIVYGGTDGVVTTFAVVAGAMGASVSHGLILIFGFANLFADGFSMAFSNYLSSESENDLQNKKNKKPIHNAIATFFAFLLIGLIPLLSFLFSPLSNYIQQNEFVLSIILTGVAFLIIGAIRGEVVGKHKAKSALETFIMGAIASAIAFAVGYMLRIYSIS